MRKLRVAVGMRRALTRLAVGLQAIPVGLQQSQHRAVDDLMAHRAQRLGELRAALGRPPQRRLRTTARDRIHKPIKILPELRLTLQNRNLPCSETAHTARRKNLAAIEILQPAQHGGLRDPRRPNHRRDPAMTRRPRLRRSPQPPTALIQHALRVQQPVPLTDRTLINHDPPVLHNTPNSCTNQVVSP